MSFLRSNFTRAGGESFELIKGGRHTVLWRVNKDGKSIRFEVWRTYRGAFGEAFYEIGENGSGSFPTLYAAEHHFEWLDKRQSDY
jgi:hypothetical protein